MISGNIFWMVVLLLNAGSAYFVISQVVKYGNVNKASGGFTLTGFAWLNLELNVSCGGGKRDLTIRNSTVNSVQSGTFWGWRCRKDRGEPLFSFMYNTNPRRTIIFNVDLREVMFKQLTIQNNKEINISSDTKFSPKTTIIYLGGNAINNIPKNLFRNLTALKFLGLANNRLKCLHEDLFKDLKSLKTLYLSDNKIQYLPKDIFKATLGTIENIELQNNELKWLSSDQFRFRFKKVDTGFFPIVNAENNNLVKLPRCLAQLSIFKYTATTNLTLTGDKQPDDTAPEDICEGADAYNYPAIQCYVTNNPDPYVPKIDFIYYTFFTLCMAGSLVLVVWLGVTIADIRNEWNTDGKFRHKRNKAKERRTTFLDERKSTFDDTYDIVESLTDTPSKGDELNAIDIESTSARKSKKTQSREAPHRTNELKNMTLRVEQKKGREDMPQETFKIRRELEVTHRERSVVSSSSDFISLSPSSESFKTQPLELSSKNEANKKHLKNVQWFPQKVTSYYVVPSKSDFISLKPIFNFLKTRLSKKS